MNRPRLFIDEEYSLTRITVLASSSAVLSRSLLRSTLSAFSSLPLTFLSKPSSPGSSTSIGRFQPLNLVFYYWADSAPVYSRINQVSLVGFFLFLGSESLYQVHEMRYLWRAARSSESLSSLKKKGVQSWLQMKSCYCFLHYCSHWLRPHCRCLEKDMVSLVDMHCFLWADSQATLLYYWLFRSHCVL